MTAASHRSSTRSGTTRAAGIARALNEPVVLRQFFHDLLQFLRDFNAVGPKSRAATGLAGGPNDAQAEAFSPAPLRGGALPFRVPPFINEPEDLGLEDLEPEDLGPGEPGPQR